MKILILGGGTAGWLTSYFIRSVLPDSEITLIENKKIGIVGVGEATTPNIISFLNSIGIDINDFISRTKGSIKSGISFENWNGDGKKYFHPFQDKIVDFYIPNIFNTDCSDYHFKSIIENNLPLEDYHYCTHLAYQNKIDLEKHLFALHFDTNLVSTFFKEESKKRKIDVIDGTFESVKIDANGYIEGIFLDENRYLKCDFVFDCSGFSRLLIGKVYNQKWISYKDHLPMKKGLPFWLEKEETIKPYTTALALKNGWIWKIPLQHRIGSGYIFDSDFIDESQAIEEAEKELGKKINVNRVIDFDAGHFENFWVKNCMAVGLSSSFIEPLESTSIFLTIQQLETFRHFLNEMRNPNENSLKLFNEIVTNNMEDTLSFVYLHYMTKRNDSDFWKNFRHNYKPPKKLQNILSFIKENNLRHFITEDTKTTGNFSLYSFLCVSYGLGIFENKINNCNYGNLIPSVYEYGDIIKESAKNSIDHEVFLKHIDSLLNK